MSQAVGSIVTGVLMVILLIAVIVLTIITLRLSGRVSRMNRRFRLLMKGDEGENLEKALLKRLNEAEKMQTKETHPPKKTFATPTLWGEENTKLKQFFFFCCRSYNI